MIGLAARLLGGIFTPLIDQLSASSARLLRKLALFVVAAVAMVVVLIALTIAFDLWIASLTNAIVGALAVAGVYLAIAAVAIFLALRPARPVAKAQSANAEGKASRDDPAGRAQIDDFAAPLLAILQRLGLRREQLAVLAGTSVAKQLGPVPLVGLAIVAGFLVGRMWKGWNGLLSSNLVTALLSTDLLATLFGSRAEAGEERDDEV